MSIARILGIAITLGVVSFGAAAQVPEWQYLGVNTGGVAILAKEPRRVEGAVTMWVRFLYADHLITALEEYDCGRGRTRGLTIKQNAYAKEGGVGTLIGMVEGPEPWVTIAPDTVAESLLQRACGKGA